MKNYIEPELVRKHYSYNKETGELTKLLKPAPRLGKIGTIKASGTKVSPRYYLRVKLFGARIYAQRLIWVIVTGEQPLEIDHIDGDGLNNKWTNLRNVTHSENGRNQKKHSSNTSGTVGVFERKSNGRWRAVITVQNKVINLGTFTTKDEAMQARKEAEKKYNFYLNQEIRNANYH